MRRWPSVCRWRTGRREQPTRSLWMQMQSSWVAGGQMVGDGLAVYPPTAFAGDMHLISIRPDVSNEYRNLAENPADQRGDVAAYPHATANVETRNESGFAARNVIDGEHIACGHGEWPFGSWGIGARTDAKLTLDFGRVVEIDMLTLYLRADFPHDAYWISGTVTLDDGFSKTFPLEGRDGAQRVELGRHGRAKRPCLLFVLFNRKALSGISLREKPADPLHRGALRV